MLGGPELENCSLGQGDVRRVDGDQGTTVASRYTLKRWGDAELKKDYKAGGHVISKGSKVPYFEATVDLKFKDGDDAASAKLQSKYETKARECYKEATPYLRGPNGEFLVLKLAKDDPGMPKPPPSEIAIADSGKRADSEDWNSDIDCPTILHETMHLLGLVDEYRETWIGAKVDKKTGRVSHTEESADKPIDDCRALGPRDSLMFHQDDAYDAAGMTKILGIFSRTPKRPSLLYPAEFNSIVAPGCASVNKTYFACSRKAISRA